MIEKCDEILGQFPYNPNAICYKGVSLHKLGETDEALNILEKGVETNPDDCPLRNNLALIYCKNTKKSLKLCKESFKVKGPVWIA